MPDPTHRNTESTTDSYSVSTTIDSAPNNYLAASSMPHSYDASSTGSRSQPVTKPLGAAEKVWIPRLSHREVPSTRQRTKHACEACRRRRIRCDGAKPMCKGCAADGIECLYTDHKRARDRQEMKSLKSTVDQYETLLQDLLCEVPAGLARQIQSSLTSNERLRISRKQSSSSSSDASDISLDGMDTVNEDLNRTEESRMTGFMGKTSVPAWLRDLEPNSGSSCASNLNLGATTNILWNQSMSSQAMENKLALSYFLDDQELPSIDSVDTFKLPSKVIADQLLNSYFETIHPSFPIVRIELFLEQYRCLWALNSQPRPGHRWLAVFNMMLAIGCKRLQVYQSNLPPGLHHEVFFARARLLSANENFTYDNSDLQQVQIEALVTLYFMVTMQINRAWKICGVAVRSAMALALNLRIVDTDLQPGSKEARSRLWWSIYLLETILSKKTGRPSCIGSTSFSVDQPLTFPTHLSSAASADFLPPSDFIREKYLRWSLEEEEMQQDEYDPVWLNDIETCQGLQFYYLIDLTHIVHIAVGELFSPKGLQANKTYIKRRIQFYDDKVDHWLYRLPSQFRFVDQKFRFKPQKLSKEQVLLALHHYSARITLYRPCSPFRQFAGTNEKELLCLRESCLDAALSMISILPDAFDIQWVYNVSPWWCILHFIMQASTMLIIIYADNRGHFKEDFVDTEGKAGNDSEIVVSCRKAHRWLYGLSQADQSYCRAYGIYDGLLRRLGLIDWPDESTTEQMSNNFPELVTTSAEDLSSHVHAATDSKHSNMGSLNVSGKQYGRDAVDINALSSVFDPSIDAGRKHPNDPNDAENGPKESNKRLMTDQFSNWWSAVFDDRNVRMDFS